jgi:RNA polymerase sigma factor (sigma-70 family)
MTAMPMTNRADLELLREYADHGSQPAFCELVRRYIDLVYSSAVRQVGDAHTAEDVTQIVFIILTKKARELRPGLLLSGWLLGVTRFAARDHLKRERRRRHYEQAAALERTAIMMSAENGASRASSSESEGGVAAAGMVDGQIAKQFATVLDDALAKLRASARDAMVLRYFENQSFKQVGERLGISELAARQRVFRALEQLRTILGHRGVSLGRESLAVALGATAVLAAPGALSAAVAATATSASGAAPYAMLVKGTVSLMKISKAKSVLVIVLLLLISAGVVMISWMSWHKDDQHPIVVSSSPADASRARTIPLAGAGAGNGSSRLIDLIPPENYTAPSFGWVGTRPKPTPAPMPYVGPPISGTVLSPQGKPQNNLQIMLLLPTMNPDPIGGQPQGPLGIDYPAAATDANGRFEFKPQREFLGLFVRSPQGYGWVPADSIKPDQTITMSQWGRLEVVVKREGKPVSQMPVILDLGRRADFQRVFGRLAIVTDADGRVIFDQAFPGETRVTLAADDAPKPAGRQKRDDSSKLPPREIRVNVEAGKTNKVALGGVGRPVTGAIEGDLRDFDYRRGVLKWSDPQGGQSGTIYFDARGDGVFTVMEVPPGDCEIAIDLGVTWGKNIRIVETYAVARAKFKMPPVPGDFSEEPLEIGKIALSEKKVLQVGEAFPKLAGKNDKGETISSADYHGKILLVEIAGQVDSRSRGEIEWQHTVHERFGRHPAFAMLTVAANQSVGPQATPAGAAAQWPIMRLDAGQLPEELEAVNPGLFLVDENGKLAAKNVTAAQVYAMLDRALEGKPDPRVKFDCVARGAARQNPPYENIPGPSADDAAAGARVRIIGGVPSWDTPKSDSNVLTDGRMPDNEDAPAEALFFQAGSLEGRFRLDLKEPTNVAEIRTYSWHKDTRAAQVYRVYGSDGTDKNFDPAPALGVDPIKHGWTNIAFVDTRPEMKPVGVQYVAQGGRYVSSISDKEKGTLGTYRHLLFQVFVTEADDVFGHTFYEEIDVIARK